MGYTTEFTGAFQLNKPLNAETKEFLMRLSRTRRMKRNVVPEYGVEGEFYVNGTGMAGQDRDATIVDYNKPPSTQPSLWCDWIPTDDGLFIEWNGGEKFYNYVEWITYIVDKILKPHGYILSGEVTWQGEDSYDRGMIVAKDNVITTKTGRWIYE
jgi:hypothetical protein